MGSAPEIKIQVYAPQKEEGRISLSQQIAAVHAQAVGQYIARLSCPSSTKSRLVDAIREKSR